MKYRLVENGLNEYMIQCQSDLSSDTEWTHFADYGKVLKVARKKLAELKEDNIKRELSLKILRVIEY